MRKVLFIACLYPPIANSGTQRSLKFANYLPDFGWTPIVLTAGDADIGLPREPALLQEVRQGTHIERVRFWNEKFAIKIGRALRAFFPEERMVDGLSWRIRSLWGLPDEWAFWRPTAVKRALEVFQNEGFDCIYATGFPWTSFLVARDIAQRTGKPYILDYRDLWTCWEVDWNKSSRLVRWMSHRQELKVLKNASTIVTVTDTMAQVLKNMVPTSSRCPVVCITNGFDPDDFQVEPAHKEANNKVRIVYTGVWKVGYSPKALYDAMQLIQQDFPEAMHRLDVVCAGFSPGVSGQKSLDGAVHELGRVAHGEAIALMKSADFLFLPVSEGGYALGSLPGKLFEYLAAHKPIIAMVPAKSEVALLLNKLGSFTQFNPDDVRGLANVLVDIALSRSTTWEPPDVTMTACFERKYLASELADILTTVSDSKHTFTEDIS
jgi:hypothetical protein